jgi:hypothetical protein
MRIIVTLLLLANLAFFALTRLDAYSAGEGQRLGQQVQPDKIRLLTPQEVVALGPAKAAALADVCIEWGPLGDAERNRALDELAAVGGAQAIAQRRVDGDGFVVTLAGFPSAAAAERRVAELRARNVGDLSVLDLGRGEYAVALGTYRTEASATGRADALAQQGIAGARVVPRNGGPARTVLVARDPPPTLVAKMRELAPSYPGTEIRVGACERPQ